MIKQKPRLTKFMILSLFLHIVGVYANYIFPEKKIESSGKKLLKVRFIPPGVEKSKTLKFVKNQNSEKLKSHKTEKLISNSKSRAYSRHNTYGRTWGWKTRRACGQIICAVRVRGA